MSSRTQLLKVRPVAPLGPCSTLQATVTPGEEFARGDSGVKQITTV